MIAERLMGKEALGQGDIKLLGFIGAFCGWQGGVFVIFGGAVIGTALLVPVMIYKKFFGSRYAATNEDNIDWGMEVPFGPFLGIAALLYFLGIRDLVEDWFEGIISISCSCFLLLILLALKKTPFRANVITF